MSGKYDTNEDVDPARDALALPREIEAPRDVPIYRQELLPLKTTDTNVSGTSAAAH